MGVLRAAGERRGEHPGIREQNTSQAVLPKKAGGHQVGATGIQARDGGVGPLSGVQVVSARMCVLTASPALALTLRQAEGRPA